MCVTKSEFSGRADFSSSPSTASDKFSCTVSWSFVEEIDSVPVDFKNLGPEIAITRAPIGAVTMIDSTAIVNTISPRDFNSSFSSFMAWSNASPPIAAYRKR